MSSVFAKPGDKVRDLIQGCVAQYSNVPLVSAFYETSGVYYKFCVRLKGYIMKEYLDLIKDLSPLIKDLLPLFGVLIGGSIAFFSNIFIEIFRDRRKVKNIAHAFRGEISALLKIVERRKYIELIEEEIENNSMGFVNIPVNRTYFNVYMSNSSNIGLLKPTLTSDISQFYTNANSILEDFESIRNQDFQFPEEGHKIEFEKNLLKLLKETVSLGAKIISDISKTYK